MQINISGQQMDLTPALRDYVQDKMSRVARHFDHVITAAVVLRVEKTRHLADATINARGSTIRAAAEADDMYATIDILIDKLDRQVIKHKEKQGDHHQSGGALKDQPVL